MHENERKCIHVWHKDFKLPGKWQKQVSQLKSHTGKPFTTREGVKQTERCQEMLK